MGKHRKSKISADYFLKRLRKHFGVDPGDLVVVTQAFAVYDRPNIHLALEELLARRGTKAELEGIVAHDTYESPSLARLSRQMTARGFLPGPVEYHDVELAGGKRLACVKSGVYWVKTRGGPVAMMIGQDRHRFPPEISVEVMATTRGAAEDFGREFSSLVQRGDAFRGQVLSLELDCHHQMRVRFHRLPAISRDELILPAEVLRRLDR
jgi:hypothetical protein